MVGLTPANDGRRRQRTIASWGSWGPLTSGLSIDRHGALWNAKCDQGCTRGGSSSDANSLIDLDLNLTITVLSNGEGALSTAHCRLVFDHLSAQVVQIDTPLRQRLSTVWFGLG